MIATEWCFSDLDIGDARVSLAFGRGKAASAESQAGSRVICGDSAYHSSVERPWLVAECCCRTVIAAGYWRIQSGNMHNLAPDPIFYFWWWYVMVSRFLCWRSIHQLLYVWYGGRCMCEWVCVWTGVGVRKTLLNAGRCYTVQLCPLDIDFGIWYLSKTNE